MQTPGPTSSSPNRLVPSPPMNGVFISSFEKKLAGSGSGLITAAKEYSVSVSKTKREAVYVNAKPSPNKISSEIYQVFEKDAERMEMIISNEKLKLSGGQKSSSLPLLENVSPNGNESLGNHMIRSLSFETLDDSLMSVSEHTKSPPVSAYRDFIHMNTPVPVHVIMEDPVTISSSVLLGDSTARPSLFPSMTSPIVPSSSTSISKRSGGMVRKQKPHSSGGGFLTILKVSLSMVVFLCCLFGPLLVFNDLRRQLSGIDHPTPSSSSSSRRGSMDDNRIPHRHLVMDNNGTSDSNSNTLIDSSNNNNNNKNQIDHLVIISEPTKLTFNGGGLFSRIISGIRSRNRNMNRLQLVHEILASDTENFEISGRKGALSSSIPFHGFGFLTGNSLGGKTVGGSGVADWCW